MTQEIEKIREAVKSLSNLNDSEWELMSVLIETMQSRSMQNETEEVKDYSVERVTAEVLKEIGVPANLNGYKYLKAAILVCIETQDDLQVTRKLYPMLARKFNTRASSIEHGIYNAIEVAWKRGDSKIHFEIFGNYMKPSAEEMIFTLKEYVEYRLK